MTARGRAIDALRKGTAEAAVTRALRRHDRRKLEAAREVLAEVRGALEDDGG